MGRHSVNTWKDHKHTPPFPPTSLPSPPCSHRCRDGQNRLADATNVIDTLRAKEVEVRAVSERDRAAAEEAERALRQTRYQCEDSLRLKDQKINELGSQGQALEEANEAMAKEYETKMSDLLTSLHDVEKAFVEQRTKHEESLARTVQSHNDQLSKLKSHYTQLSSATENKLTAQTERAEQLLSTNSDLRADYENQLATLQVRKPSVCRAGARSERTFRQSTRLVRSFVSNSSLRSLRSRPPPVSPCPHLFMLLTRTVRPDQGSDCRDDELDHSHRDREPAEGLERPKLHARGGA